MRWGYCRAGVGEGCVRSVTHVARVTGQSVCVEMTRAVTRECRLPRDRVTGGADVDRPGCGTGRGYNDGHLLGLTRASTFSRSC